MPRPVAAHEHHVPQLLELIEMQRFGDVIARIKAKPSEATLTLSGHSGAHNSIMNQGNLALHEACKNQPSADLINVLLAANENALKTKGQWGYLPLHFACCSRAAPEVVAKLIIAYPSATRAKDDHEGTLPLHLAAKWGASDEVIMALLTVHPKASVARDMTGKTPIEHANLLSSPHVRDSVLTALMRAPILCAVSKAAMNKMTYESEAKLREVVEVYQERMTRVKEKFEDDKNTTVSLEVQLRKELWDEKDRSLKLSEKLARLSHTLESKEKELLQKDKILHQIQGLFEKSESQQQPERRDQERSDEEQRDQERKDQERRDQVEQRDQSKVRDASNERQERRDQERSDQERRDQERSDQERRDQERRDQERREHERRDQERRGQERRDQVEQRDQSEARDASDERHDEQDLAKAAAREWVSAGTQGYARDILKVSTDMDQEQDFKPLISPSPKSAAVAKVKEWFSGERDHTEEESRRHSKGGKRDKADNYIAGLDQQRSPYGRPSGGTPSRSQDHALRSNDVPSPKQSSLLGRSKSAPRQKSVLSRREVASRHSSDAERSRQSPSPTQDLHQPQHSRQSYSTSSRTTPTQRNTGNGGRKSASRSASSRRIFDDDSRIRPRESYSGHKASSSAYSQRIYNNGEDESLTMDSGLADWE
jgi:hypothetical protein